MLCHDVDDVLKHLKREHIEVRGTFINVSDSLSKCIEILIDISVELDAIIRGMVADALQGICFLIMVI